MGKIRRNEFIPSASPAKGLHRRGSRSDKSPWKGKKVTDIKSTSNSGGVSGGSKVLFTRKTEKKLALSELTSHTPDVVELGSYSPRPAPLVAPPSPAVHNMPTPTLEIAKPKLLEGEKFSKGAFTLTEGAIGVVDMKSPVAGRSLSGGNENNSVSRSGGNMGSLVLSSLNSVENLAKGESLGGTSSTIIESSLNSTMLCALKSPVDNNVSPSHSKGFGTPSPTGKGKSPTSILEIISPPVLPSDDEIGHNRGNDGVVEGGTPLPPSIKPKTIKERVDSPSIPLIKKDGMLETLPPKMFLPTLSRGATASPVCDLDLDSLPLVFSLSGDDGEVMNKPMTSTTHKTVDKVLEVEMRKLRQQEAIVNEVFNALFPNGRYTPIKHRNSNDGDSDENNAGVALDCADRLGIRNALEACLFINGVKQQQANTIDDPCSSSREETVNFYFPPNVLYTMVSQVVDESPLQSSPRMKIIKSLLRLQPALALPLGSALDMSTTQFFEIEQFHFNNRDAVTLDGNGKPALEHPVFPSLGNSSGLAHLFTHLVQVVRSLIFGVDGNNSNSNATSRSRRAGAVDNIGNMLHTLTRIFITLCKCQSILGAHFDPLITCAICMVRMHAAVAPTLYQRIVRVWPCGNSPKEAFFLQLIERLLLATPPVMHQHPSMLPVFEKVFQRVSRSITSLHCSVARQAVVIVSNMYILMNYILPSETISTMVKAALADSFNHWNPTIREMCNSQFERMLDLC